MDVCVPTPTSNTKYIPYIRMWNKWISCARTILDVNIWFLSFYFREFAVFVRHTGRWQEELTRCHCCCCCCRFYCDYMVLSAQCCTLVFIPFNFISLHSPFLVYLFPPFFHICFKAELQLHIYQYRTFSHRHFFRIFHLCTSQHTMYCISVRRVDCEWAMYDLSFAKPVLLSFLLAGKCLKWTPSRLILSLVEQHCYTMQNWAPAEEMNFTQSVWSKMAWLIWLKWYVLPSVVPNPCNFSLNCVHRAEKLRIFIWRYKPSAGVLAVDHARLDESKHDPTP